MSRSPSRTLLFTMCIMMTILVITSPVSTAAQATDEWFGDCNIQVYIGLDGRSITSATEDDPIVINTEGNTTLRLAVNVNGTVAIYNLTGSLGFYYQSIQLFTIDIRQAVVEEIPPGTNMTPVEAEVNLGAALRTQISEFTLDLATGIFQASVNFRYHLAGENPDVDPAHTFLQSFYLTLPAQDFLDVVTSVAGIATTVATVGAVAGVGMNFKVLIDGLSTAHKLRSIQKKAGELRSLPNLTVIGALPALFSVVSVLKLREKKKTVEEKEDSGEGVSEYLVRQRLREVAPDAFPGDKCPKCKSKWNKQLKTCKKCHIELEEAQRMYADLLVTKLPKALKVLNKNKSLSIKKLSKKTKSNQYNAGVIGATMVDTGLTEITKIETPFRSFLMNIGGLVFLIVTWQQLLGGAASSFQTTLTLVGAALSVAVIIALYFARKTQVKKLQATLDEGRPIMPTTDEKAADAPPEQHASADTDAGEPTQGEDGAGNDTDGDNA